MVKFAALKSLYDVEKTIGTGGFAKVKLGTHLLTGEKVAIKIMEKSCLGDDYPRVRIELEALKSISHHHICKLYQVIETPTHFFMIMEYCSGGELFDHIVEKNRLSESESRMFFRQILSAVAYLHSKGYVHRDLKPENILLDKNLDIKLIDFGLCAKPEGGMTTHLQTSCGSPTYAAPELIKGRKYIGSEVDVWSLGVLLFALLCGFLPFDSDTIDNLYKKILSGKYDEPPWLAKESKEIISQMLQIEPSKRISVENLLSHTWLTMGYFEPVIYSTLLELREKDDDVVDLMATYYGVCAKTMWKRLEMWQYNYDTATYQLLLVRKKQGLPLRLNTQHRPRYRIKASSIPINLELAENDVTSSPKRQSYLMLKAVMNNNDMGIYDNLIGKENNLADTSSKTVRTVRKRMHTCGPDDVQSPVPSKRTPGKGCSTPSTSSDSPVTSTTPTPSKGLFCSLEKKLNQVRNVLTPKKRIKTPNKQQMKNGEQPVILSTKNLCNVSTTSYVNPEFVLEELRKALDGKGINCKSKGFTLRGKIEESDTKSGSCKLYFELEVCLVKPAGGNVTDQPLVGIRRKRLKGDAWCYKKICEEILRLAKNSVS